MVVTYLDIYYAICSLIGYHAVMSCMYVNIFLLEQKGKKETTSVIHSWYLAVPATVKYHLAISLYLILLATFQFYINVIQIPKYKIKQKRFMYFHKLNTLCTNWSNLKHLQTAVVSHIRIFHFFRGLLSNLWKVLTVFDL